MAQTADPRRSGYQEMGASLRAMQDDDSANPGMLWVGEGRALWAKREGAAGKACADCHAGETSMSGVAARYPTFDVATSKPIDLGQRVNRCRVEQQQAEPLGGREPRAGGAQRLHRAQSRGQPIAPPDDPRLRPFVEAGRGRCGGGGRGSSTCPARSATTTMPAAGWPAPPSRRATPTGYPIYRLEWQAAGSLKRRLRNCLVGMRAEPYAYDSAEYAALELYLMRRAKGMTFEAPGVRP